MFKKFQFLPRLTTFSEIKALGLPSKYRQPLSMMRKGQASKFPNSFNHQSRYSFFSFQGIFQTKDKKMYEDDLGLLGEVSWKHQMGAKFILERHFNREELDSEEKEWVLWFFQKCVSHQITQGNREKALEYLTEIQEIYDSQGMKNDPEVALNYYGLAIHCVDVGQFTKAKDNFTESIRICRLFPDNKNMADLVLLSFMTLADVYRYIKETDKAIEAYNYVIERADEVPEYSRNVLISLYERFGYVYLLRNESDKALDIWKKGLEKASKYFEEDPKETFPIYKALIVLLQDDFKYLESLEYTEKALKVALKTFPKENPEVAKMYWFHGYPYFRRAQYSKAFEFYREATEIYEKLPLQNKMKSFYMEMAIILLSMGKHAEASDFFMKACTTKSKDSFDLARLHFEWGRALLQHSNITEAQIHLKKSLEMYTNQNPLNKFKIAQVYLCFGEIAFSEKNWTEALEHFKECEKSISGLSELENPYEFQKLYAYLSAIYLRLKNYHESIQYIEKTAFAIGNSNIHIYDAVIIFNAAVIAEQEGMPKTAFEDYSKAANFNTQQIQSRTPNQVDQRLFELTINGKDISLFDAPERLKFVANF